MSLKTVKSGHSEELLRQFSVITVLVQLARPCLKLPTSRNTLPPKWYFDICDILDVQGVLPEESHNTEVKGVSADESHNSDHVQGYYLRKTITLMSKGCELTKAITMMM